MDKNKTFLYLDFNGKVAADTFEKDVFIRIANLHKKNPLVQVNDIVFKGTYDFALGSNLFFEEIKEGPPTNDLFLKRGPVPFECISCTTKIVSLKRVKIPSRKVPIANETKKIEFNLNWDYKTLLDKFAEGSLKLSDILLNSDSNEVEPIEEDKVINNEVNAPSVEKEVNTPSKESFIVEDIFEFDSIEAKGLLEDYQRLRKLAFRPMKTIKKEENVPQCDPKFKSNYEYHNLQCQILQPSDYFSTEPVDQIDEETLFNCVDINRCILYGLLDKSKNYPRILSNEEKRKLLSLDNFDNLSLSARYYVINNYVKNLEEHINKKAISELSCKDFYGRTAWETLDIYKKLANALRRRIEEIKCCAKNDNVNQLETDRDNN